MVIPCCSSRGERREFVTEGGMYFDMPVDVGARLRLTPGLRLHSFPSRSQVALEPRMQAEWRPGGETSRHVFSTAWGIYHQQIIGLYNAHSAAGIGETVRGYAQHAAEAESTAT